MLKAENLQVYQNQRLVLANLSYAVKPGEFWGIVGKNGVGKSTLLETMAGLMPPKQGTVTVDGDSLATLDPLSRARKIAYLMQEQEPSLAFTVEQAVAMGRFPWLESTQKQQQISDEILSLCRIDNLRYRSILHLSGGERRKVEIATCLAQQADYLLLDEPFNHLDLVYKKYILERFKECSQTKAVVMVCHDLDVVAAHCSHVLMLLGKECYLAGDSATILSSSNLQRLFDDSD